MARRHICRCSRHYATGTLTRHSGFELYAGLNTRRFEKGFRRQAVRPPAWQYKLKARGTSVWY